MSDERCKELVSEPPRFWHSHRCDRPAKWAVNRVGDAPKYVCGVHVKHYKRLPLDFVVEEFARRGEPSHD